MNADHEPKNLSRRRLAQGGLAAPVVLASLASKNAFAAMPYHCTISGKMSNNMSAFGPNKDPTAPCVVPLTSAEVASRLRSDPTTFASTGMHDLYYSDGTNETATALSSPSTPAAPPPPAAPAAVAAPPPAAPAPPPYNPYRRYGASDGLEGAPEAAVAFSYEPPEPIESGGFYSTSAESAPAMIVAQAWAPNPYARGGGARPPAAPPPAPAPVATTPPPPAPPDTKWAQASLYNVLKLSSYASGVSQPQDPLFAKMAVVMHYNATAAPSSVFPLTKRQVCDMFNAAIKGMPYNGTTSVGPFSWTPDKVKAYFASMYA